MNSNARFVFVKFVSEDLTPSPSRLMMIDDDHRQRTATATTMTTCSSHAQHADPIKINGDDDGGWQTTGNTNLIMKPQQAQGPRNSHNNHNSAGKKRWNVPRLVMPLRAASSCPHLFPLR